MNDVMEYKIVIAHELVRSLEQAVNQAINDGWQPCGGICATTHQGSGVVSYYQAMTRSTSALSQTLREPLSANVTPTPITAFVVGAPEVPTAAAGDGEALPRPRQKKGVTHAH